MTTDVPASDASISDLLRQLRVLINIPRKCFILLENRKVWYMLTSSMDVIEDSELAIDAYLTGSEEDSEVGKLYLGLYGILQVLFVQQDAVKHLCESLGIEYAPDGELDPIRRIRNESIGHPTKQGREPDLAFHYVTRISMSRKGFKLMSARGGSPPQFTEIDVIELTHKQRMSLGNALSNVVAQLREEELNHRKHFRDQKLEEIFGSDLAYNFEKISNAISDSANNQLGRIHVDLVLNKVAEFRGALDERGLLQAYELEELLRMADYSLSELRSYLVDPADSRLRVEDAVVFHDYAKRRLEQLVGIARAIPRS